MVDCVITFPSLDFFPLIISGTGKFMVPSGIVISVFYVMILYEYEYNKCNVAVLHI